MGDTIATFEDASDADRFENAIRLIEDYNKKKDYRENPPQYLQLESLDPHISGIIGIEEILTKINYAVTGSEKLKLTNKIVGFTYYFFKKRVGELNDDFFVTLAAFTKNELRIIISTFDRAFHGSREHLELDSDSMQKEYTQEELTKLLNTRFTIKSFHDGVPKLQVIYMLKFVGGLDNDLSLKALMESRESFQNLPMGLCNLYQSNPIKLEHINQAVKTLRIQSNNTLQNLNVSYLLSLDKKYFDVFFGKDIQIELDRIDSILRDYADILKVGLGFIFDNTSYLYFPSYRGSVEEYYNMVFKLLYEKIVFLATAYFNAGESFDQIVNENPSLRKSLEIMFKFISDGEAFKLKSEDFHNLYIKIDPEALDEFNCENSYLKWSWRLYQDMFMFESRPSFGYSAAFTESEFYKVCDALTLILPKLEESILDGSLLSMSDAEIEFFSTNGFESSEYSPTQTPNMHRILAYLMLFLPYESSIKSYFKSYFKNFGKIPNDVLGNIQYRFANSILHIELRDYLVTPFKESEQSEILDILDTYKLRSLLDMPLSSLRGCIRSLTDRHCFGLILSNLIEYHMSSLSDSKKIDILSSMKPFSHTDESTNVAVYALPKGHPLNLFVGHKQVSNCCIYINSQGESCGIHAFQTSQVDPSEDKIHPKKGCSHMVVAYDLEHGHFIGSNWVWNPLIEHVYLPPKGDDFEEETVTDECAELFFVDQFEMSLWNTEPSEEDPLFDRKLENVDNFITALRAIYENTFNTLFIGNGSNSGDFVTETVEEYGLRGEPISNHEIKRYASPLTVEGSFSPSKEDVYQDIPVDEPDSLSEHGYSIIIDVNKEYPPKYKFWETRTFRQCLGCNSEFHADSTWVHESYCDYCAEFCEICDEYFPNSEFIADTHSYNEPRHGIHFDQCERCDSLIDVERNWDGNTIREDGQGCSICMKKCDNCHELVDEDDLERAGTTGREDICTSCIDSKGYVKCKECEYFKEQDDMVTEDVCERCYDEDEHG